MLPPVLTTCIAVSYCRPLANLPAAGSYGARPVGVKQLQGSAVGAWLIRGVSKDQYLLRRAGEIFPAIGATIRRVNDRVDCCVDIEPALVVLCRAMLHIEPQIGQVLITSGIFFVSGPQ